MAYAWRVVHDRVPEVEALEREVVLVVVHLVADDHGAELLLLHLLEDLWKGHARVELDPAVPAYLQKGDVVLERPVLQELLRAEDEAFGHSVRGFEVEGVHHQQGTRTRLGHIEVGLEAAQRELPSVASGVARHI
eukprot:5583608-Pleurochrysis_carterae.AAC.1